MSILVCAGGKDYLLVVWLDPGRWTYCRWMYNARRIHAPTIPLLGTGESSSGLPRSGVLLYLHGSGQKGNCQAQFLGACHLHSP